MQDLVIPSFKSPKHYRASPLMGNAPQHRDILLFFKVSRMGGGEREQRGRGC